MSRDDLQQLENIGTLDSEIPELILSVIKAIQADFEGTKQRLIYLGSAPVLTREELSEYLGLLVALSEYGGAVLTARSGMN